MSQHTPMPWEKQFDVDVALRHAGEAFWSHGYEATSLTDLLDAMGIQKGSFYDTYGSKRDVYLQALEQYVSTRFAAFEALAEGKQPRQALKTLLKAVFDESVSPEGHRGCMVINCALELAHEDEDAQAVVRRAFATHERLFAKHIVAGQKAGEIPSEIDASASAKAMLAIVMGMRVYARSGASRSTLRMLFHQALSLIER